VEVFFHTNGYGDCVLFDELGYPWEVHACWEMYRSEHRAAMIELERSLQAAGYNGTFYRPTGSRVKPSQQETDLALSVVGYVADNHAFYSEPEELHWSVNGDSESVPWVRFEVGVGDGQLYPFLLPRSLAKGVKDYVVVQVSGRWLEVEGTWLLIATSLVVIEYPNNTHNEYKIISKVERWYDTGIPCIKCEANKRCRIDLPMHQVEWSCPECETRYKQTIKHLQDEDLKQLDYNEKLRLLNFIEVSLKLCEPVLPPNWKESITQQFWKHWAEWEGNDHLVLVRIKRKNAKQPRHEKRVSLLPGQSQGRRFRILLKSYDGKVVDQVARRIAKAVGESATSVRGPMPSKKGNPPVHKRIIDVIEPDAEAIDFLESFDLPNWIDVEIKS
jgi:ribosomal protein S10